jgi:hypothetical protein
MAIELGDASPGDEMGRISYRELGLLVMGLVRVLALRCGSWVPADWCTGGIGRADDPCLTGDVGVLVEWFEEFIFIDHRCAHGGGA